MKKYKKKILAISCLAIILIGSLIQIQNTVVFTNEFKNLEEKCFQNEDANNICSHNILNDEENPIIPPEFWEILSNLDADNWGYEEWKRYAIVDFSNLTEEAFYQYTENHPEANYYLNILIRLLWGTYNHTLSENESQSLINQLKQNHTTKITSCDISQFDDNKVVIDVTYYVHSVPWWQDLALTLEVRFNSDREGSQWYRTFPDPETVTFYYWNTGPYTYNVRSFGGYPLNSGKRVYNKYLQTVDKDVFDDKGTPYTEHIEISTGFLETNLVIHTIITSMVPPWKYTFSTTYHCNNTIEVLDDDDDPPEFEDFQACFEGDYPQNKEPGKILYIFTDPNNPSKPLNDTDILIRTTYSDASGVDWSKKRILYQFKDENGNLLYESGEIYQKTGARPMDFFRIPNTTINQTGWRDQFDELDSIEISCIAADLDNDRVNDYLESQWTQWIRVAKVVNQTLDLELFNIQLEYSNDILKPSVKYNPYVGENIAFSLTLVNGMQNDVQVKQIQYAVVPADHPIEPTYITQSLTSFKIPNGGSGSTPWFNPPELLEQFDEIGNYTILIRVFYTHLLQAFLADFEDSFEVTTPEKPLISFFSEDLNLNLQKFTLLTDFFMYYKNLLFNIPKVSEWTITVENPSRLKVNAHDTLRFELTHLKGRSSNKLWIRDGSAIDISVNPLNSETYPFSLEITDTTVFPTLYSQLPNWLELCFSTSIFDAFASFIGFHDILDFLNIFDTSDVGGYMALGEDARALIGDIYLFYEHLYLDWINIFNINCLTEDISWNYYSSANEEKFSRLYYDVINTTELSFNVTTSMSPKQTEEMYKYFDYQQVIIGLDIASLAVGVVGLVSSNPYVAAACLAASVGLFIAKLIAEDERDKARERCDDPQPPKGDYTLPVVRNYTEAVIPRDFENNPRYTSVVYELAQSVKNLEVEREVQQEIRNRMNKAIEDNETVWVQFQLNDLRESIELEALYTMQYHNALREYNSLFIEEMVNANITDQDILFAENYVEENGITPELQQKLNFIEEREKEITWNVGNISEYEIVSQPDGIAVHNSGNDYSYLEYFSDFNINLEKLNEFNSEVNEEINKLAIEEYIDISTKSGFPSYQLNEIDIVSLENLNQSISEKLELKEWVNVIDLCDELIELTNDLSLQIFNNSHPTLLLYKYYAQAIKKQALENNRKHLIALSSSFDTFQMLEPEMTEKVKISIKLISASLPNIVELGVQNLAGVYRFLNETGAVLTHLTSSPNKTSTIYLEYSFNENVDYGTHSFNVIFREFNFNTYYHKKIVVNLVEDTDTTPPIILIEYMDGDGTDGNSGSWDVFAYDRESVINKNMIRIYIDESLVGNSFGIYDVPVELGNHTIRVEVWNNDPTTPEFAHKSVIQLIIDDDSTPPTILINYIGSGLDVDPGFFEWEVYDLGSGIHEINITIQYQSTEGSNDYNMSFIGTKTGKWDIPSNLGIYSINIAARDGDNDRTLLLDSLINKAMLIQEILDDDIDPPEVTNLEITPGIFEVNISLTASDESGIKNMLILVNGTIVEPIGQMQDGNNYFFTLSNQWLFERGYSEVEVLVEDDDDDRPNDSLISSISGSFKNVLYQMFEYVDWQLEELKSFIEENVCSKYSSKIVKKLTQAQEQLIEAFDLIENGTISCGLLKAYLAKIYLSIAELKTEIFYKLGRINDNNASYIIQSLHDIRNNIVYLKGASTGEKYGVDISYIEVELLDLFDFAEDNVKSMSVICAIRVAAEALELSIIELSFDEDPNDLLDLLDCAQNVLEHAIRKIDHLLRKERISQELADYMKNEIYQHIEAIELIKVSIDYEEPLPLGNTKTSKKPQVDTSERYVSITNTPKIHRFIIIFQQFIFLGICFILILKNLFLRLKKFNK